jgi:hypothetical protein
MLKNRSYLWYGALAAGWAFDILYWNKSPGISFFIHLLLLLGVLIFLSQQEGKRPKNSSLILVPIILGFSLLGLLRAEPFTRTLNHLLSLGFLALLILSFQGGRWYAYNMADYIVGGFRLFINTIGLPFQLISEAREEEKEDEGENEAKKSGWRKARPYITGILLALPLVAVLASLLASADPIFSEWLQDLIELLHLEKLPEYILRLFLISIWTFIVAGLLLFALLKSQDEKLVGLDQPWPPRFLGFTETTIILGAINLLFFSFVTIQFRYFFGGEKNISLDGYTYSEYARRGFGELLTVAFFTLFIIMVLSSITRRKSKRARVSFTLLTGLMTVFIGVILVSSLQRLALYEAAYGFTRLRTYSHLCIIWIGVLFLSILILEILEKHRFFTMAAVAAIAGFVLTMNVVNIDSFITIKNIQRLKIDDNDLDTYTLRNLSDDAIPTLIELAEDPNLSRTEKEDIQAILACREEELIDRKFKWQSFLVPRYRARLHLEDHSYLWEDIELEEESYGSVYVQQDDGKFYCGYSRGWD